MATCEAVRHRQEPTMPRTFAALILALAATGALSAATAQDLVGSWVVDQDATWDSWKERPEIQQVPEQMRDAVQAMAKQTMGKMSWEITDKQMVVDDGKAKKTEPYAVLSTDGDVLTIESTEEGGKARKGKVEVKAGKLLISGLDDAAKGDETAQGVLVLKRKDATAAAPAAPAEQPKKQ
jgi:hypothetical protein